MSTLAISAMSLRLEENQDEDGAFLTMAPLMDLVEQEDGCCLYCNLPGVEPDNIEIILDKEHIHVRGEARLTPARGKIYTLEFSGAIYEGRTRIPAIDPTLVEATVVDGLLRVFMPFPPRSAPVRIPVTTG